jgi:nucleoside-diphosphate-sugar epimerase
MQLFLLGATGQTGTALVDLALERGHHVTAFVRSPHKLAPRDRLTVVKGDPHDADALAAALAGHDAVLSALGTRGFANFRPHALVADCAASTVTAMERAGVRRLLLVSVAVLFPIRGLRYAFFRWFLQHVAYDLAAAEAIIRRSPLEFSLVRPPRLVGGDGPYRASVDALPEPPRPISRRAVATFMLDAVEQRAHLREVVGVTG